MGGVSSLPSHGPLLSFPVDCRQFRRDHLEYLDDTLPGDTMRAAQLHLLQCAACATHDTMVRRSLMVARSLPRITPRAGFEAQLAARLAMCPPPGSAAAAGDGEFSWDGVTPDGVAWGTARGGGGRWGWRRPVSYLAAAAMGMVAGAWWFQRHPLTTASAAAPPIAAVPSVTARTVVRPSALPAMPVLPASGFAAEEMVWFPPVESAGVTLVGPALGGRGGVRMPVATTADLPVVHFPVGARSGW